jgi:glycosyltransferase involved in cell wall biosynthesis
MTSPRPKLLLSVDWFAPGYRAGGPIRSVVNLVDTLHTEFEIYVLTSDTDLGASAPYADIPSDTWVDYEGKAQVCYLSAKTRNWRGVSRLLTEVQPDLIHLNSMFSPVFTLLPLWWWRQQGGEARMILSPRGMLHAGALQYKSLKKQLFLRLLRWSGLASHIRFHATDEQERQDIQHHLGVSPDQIVQVENIPLVPEPDFPRIDYTPGSLRLLFLSRISPTEESAVPAENALRGRFFLRRRKKAPLSSPSLPHHRRPHRRRPPTGSNARPPSMRFPSHIRVEILGEQPPTQVRALLAHASLLCILPTHGENFGHAIFEAFASGRPVLISDQTPWRNLPAQHLGWDLPLSDPSAWQSALSASFHLSPTTYQSMCHAAHQFALNYAFDRQLVQRYHALYEMG